MAILIGNTIQQGPVTQNGNLIGYGKEGLSNTPPHACYLINNTLIDERGFGGLFLDLPSSGMDLLKAWNNVFVSANAAFCNGSALATDTAANLFTSYKSVLYLMDTLAYNYHLTASSTLLIDQGAIPGFVDTINLMPVFEYVHPCSFVPRTIFQTPDIGAYEFNPETGIRSIFSSETIKISQLGDELLVSWPSPVKNASLCIQEIEGRTLYQKDPVNGISLRLHLQLQSQGVYILNLKSSQKTYHGKWVNSAVNYR